MGDSDDDFDSRRNRDKFRRERDDYGGNRANSNRSGGGDWNDGSNIQLDYNEADRSNQFRRQYPGGGGPPPGRDFPPRYNRSPGRYDMSPPHSKRVRRDWDGLDQPPTHFDPPSGSPYFHGNAGFHPNFPPALHQSAGAPSDQFNKEASDGITQPPMLSFKHFLHDQDDNIDQEEAVKRYNEYKIDFKKTQIAEFFTAHKDEDWFKYKYHPDEYPKRREEQRQIIKKRLDVFMELYNKSYLDDVSVDVENQRALTRFLDAVVIKLEGGSDHDLRALDVATSISNTTNDNDDGDDDIPKQSSNISEPPRLEKTDSSTSVEVTNSKKSPENKQTREGSVSDDGAVSDGAEDDEDDEKKINDKNETPMESEISNKKQENGSAIVESKEINEAKTSSQDNEPEAGEVPDAPRALHRTLSIFFRHLSMQTTKDDLENICKQYSGFRRVCITDPAPERKFFRRGWVTFDHSVQIRNICYELNSTKLHDVDMGAIINRELKNRIRTINGIGQHKTIVRNDLRLITKIIQQLDDRWNIWESVNNDNIEKKTQISTTDDSEISSSTASMAISSVQNKKPIGFVSHNPLLKNITEHLVEEADAEEEELLGETSNQQRDSNTFEIDKQLTKVLDRLILYLRVVHSIDYYNGTEYAQEDSMPNRCGVIHVRGSPLSSITEAELTNFMQQFEARLKPFIDFHEKLDDDEAMKLGAKNEQDEIEKFINANCQEVGKDKWSCPLSGKKFKGPEFVRKHILNKHQDKIDEAKKEVVYFNNYLYDPKRPQLPEHPSTRPGATQIGPHPSGLPLPTPSTPMAGQGLLNRPPIWPSMSAPAHPGPPSHYYNQFHQPRHPRPPFMYQGSSGPIHRAPNIPLDMLMSSAMNRQLKSYEDLDAPNEMLL
ncbi:unnamed protein product [Rotaria sordida]|uniref:Arsenite-resistance protein 2 homolog n=1 Tax=Rotaria sordida TaxID=392033 RepID=A0A819FNN0_9BILA|nr:unnamed protein product [Rotaria sordida]CAF3869727.1 unnamed protein product [Rotaria sordida]